MTSRVFISYRSSDGTDKATALARDLDELFGQEQIFLDKEDLPAGSRWRDEIARTLDTSPVLLVLVTPNYLDARHASGGLCIERADDPVRAELADGVAAGAHIIPLMCDGAVQTSHGVDLPPPFDQLSERTWRRLRAYDWRQDVARLAADLRALGLVPRAGVPEPVAIPSGPLPLFGAAAGGLSQPGIAAAPVSRRRLAIGVGVLAMLGSAGGAVWVLRNRGPVSLAGRWRASVGRRGSATSRDGDVVMVTIEQTGENLRVASSAVDIERDPDWQSMRQLWQERRGEALNRVFYRGDGVVRSDADDGIAADAPRGPRRILLSVRVDAPGAIDPLETGALRGAIDPDGQRIRGRLWLNGEQAERVVDLRREP